MDILICLVPEQKQDKSHPMRVRALSNRKG